MQRKNRAPSRAETAERRNDLATAVDVSRDRIGDTNAADQQRGQPDQREELAYAFEGLRHPRRRIATIENRETSFR